MRPAFITLLLLLASVCFSQHIPSLSPHARQQQLRPMPAHTPGVPAPLQRAAGEELTHTIFGYHPYWIADSVTRHYDFSLLSHLAYFSAEVDAATGELATVRDWEHAAVIDRAMAAGVKVQLAVTNFGAANMRALLSARAARDTLIRRIVVALQLRDADGVSIDFEAVPGDQRENLSAFFADLDAALATELPGAEISAAIPAVDWSDAWDIAVLREHIDLFFLMGYDYFWSASSSAGPVAPIQGSSYNVQRSVDTYLQNGMPPDRLLLGVPYYGYDWPVVSGSAGAATTGRAVARTYSFVQDMSAVAQRQWSTVYRNPWIPYETANWRQLWYDDRESLAEKYDLLLARNLAGAGIWALGYDGGRPELRELLREKFTRVTGLDDHAAASSGMQLTMYPQPAHREGAVNILVRGQTSAPLHCRILDALGRVRRVMRSDRVNAQLRIPLDGLSSGPYVLIVRQGARQVMAPLLIAR